MEVYPLTNTGTVGASHAPADRTTTWDLWSTILPIQSFELCLLLACSCREDQGLKGSMESNSRAYCVNDGACI